MRLSLSSSATRELTLEELDAACRTRGLHGVELVLAAGQDPEATARSVRASRAHVVALRFERALHARDVPALARASARLAVPVSVPSGAVAHASLAELTAVFAQAGGRLLLGHATNLDVTLALVEALRGVDARGSLGLAWEIRPGAEPLADAGAVLFAAKDFLQLVRLYGGGPEQSAQDGLGVGPLFVDLALSAYEGPIVMCPSRPEELPRWHKWLQSTRSAGCGTRVDALTTQVDVRDVEPKDRLDTILGAYRSLARGALLQLTVDHDPSCMYHTLQATEPEGSFVFRTFEHGPEVWRAEVKKL